MDIYKHVFSLGLKKAFSYRMNFFLGLIGFVFPLTIQYFLWTGIFRDSRNKIVFGYTLHQMLAYSIFACLTARIISGNFVFEINSDIKDGGLAKYLVRPINYFLYNLFNYLGEKIGTIIISSIMVLIICIIFYIISIGIISIPHIVLYFITLVLAMILNFCIYYCISELAFWMRDASGAIFITTLVGTIVSGGIFPLDIFGHTLRSILTFLPFSYTSYFSVSVLCNSIQYPEIFKGIFIQILWICIFLIITPKLWNKGVKKYVSVGG
jgi:ABC-2 type transport system permease protein